MPAQTKKWIKRVFANLALLAGSLLVFAVFCELVVFRFILKPADFEANAYWNGVVRYAPNQTGTFRLMDEIEAPFSINAEGWNSRRDHYGLERQERVGRVAVVGDSYVHAREVPFDRSFPELLEDRLNANGMATEIFRFGIKGAPLSQYLHMLRQEVIAYRPEVIVVLLIHNDFDESFRTRSGRFMQSFMRLEMENGIVKGEIAPAPFKPTVVDWLSRSATLGYLFRRQQINLGIGFISQLIFGGGGERNFEANIDVVDTKAVLDNVEGVMGYVFSAFADLAAETGSRLVLVMDGHRDGIYEGRALEATSTVVLQLNGLAAAAAARYGLPFLDLHPAFLADWQANGRRFNFENDGHWNVYGHELVAAEIEEFLMERGYIDSSQ